MYPLAVLALENIRMDTQMFREVFGDSDSAADIPLTAPPVAMRTHVQRLQAAFGSAPAAKGAVDPGATPVVVHASQLAGGLQEDALEGDKPPSILGSHLGQD